MRRIAAFLAVLALAGCFKPTPAPLAPGPRSLPGSETTTTTSTITSTTRPTTSTTTASSDGGGRGNGGGGGGGGKAPTTTTSTTSTSTTSTSTTSTTSTTAAPGPGGLLWHSGYDGLASADDVWQYEQEAAADRIQLVDRAPGRVMRVEVRPGDVVSGGNRNEVYARHAATHTTPADQWPDPIGSTRWYGFDLYLPNDFVSDPTGLVWLSLTQWKGARGGQPAIALEVKRENLELAGASARNLLGPIKRGQWERIVVGVHFAATNAGWVEVYRDGALALPRTYRATTTLVDGQPDPTYLKQGIYRSATWTVTHVAEFGPVSIGLSKTDVD
jgi:hypothetical protein